MPNTPKNDNKRLPGLVVTARMDALITKYQQRRGWTKAQAIRELIEIGLANAAR